MGGLILLRHTIQPSRTLSTCKIPYNADTTLGHIVIISKQNHSNTGKEVLGSAHHSPVSLCGFKGTLMSETKTSPFMNFGSLIKNEKEFLKSVQ